MGAANPGDPGNPHSLGGLLGDLLGGPGAGHNPLAKVVFGMLRGGGGPSRDSGGLGGLLRQLDAGGLDVQTASWVAVGRNQPVSGREITSAVGEAELDRLAAKAGMTREETAAGIAIALPHIVDAVTPDGKVPPESHLAVAISRYLAESSPAATRTPPASPSGMSPHPPSPPRPPDAPDGGPAPKAD